MTGPPIVAPNSPGLAVLVVKDGRKLFERGYGLRDLHTATKIDPRTNFRLASCSKQFTAIAIMLLVHDGKLRYDQKLTDVFPDFPAYGRSISIRNLLNHTGGLQDYETLMEIPDSKGKWTNDHQIQDAEVLATGQKIEPDPEGKPVTATVVTILVSPSDAERVVLASTQGTVRFVLRNGVDRADFSGPPVLFSELTPEPPAPAKAAQRSAPPPPKPYSVETFMGGAVKTDNFQ